MDRITSIIESKNFKSFKKFLQSLPDPNGYIVDDEENGTRLNLLHLISGLELDKNNSHFIESCCRLMLDGFGNGRRLDVNYLGSIERNYGITAAHIAVQWHNGAILQLLIDHECDLFLCDSYGQNVQDYAEREKNSSLIQIVEAGIFRWFAKQPHCYLANKSSDLYSFSNVSATNSKFNFANYMTNDFQDGDDGGDGNLELYDDDRVLMNQTFSQSSSFDSFESHSINNNHSSPIDPISPIKLDFVNEQVENSPNNSCFFAASSNPTSPTNRSYVVSKFELPTKDYPEIIEIFDDNQQSEEIADEIQHTNNTSFHNNSVEICENISYEKNDSIASSIDSQATEVYVYNDSKNGVQLIEERFLGSQILQEVETGIFCKNELNEEDNNLDVDSGHNDSIDELILKMTNCELYDELKKFGENPGPINDSTRQLYVKKVDRLKKLNQCHQDDNPRTNSQPTDGDVVYSSVADLVTEHFNQINEDKQKCGEANREEQRLFDRLTNYPLEFGNFIEMKFSFSEAIQLEEMLNREFASDSVDGGPKTYFVYLLLDPEITQNLPARANGCLTNGIGGDVSLHLLNPALFASFILSIFYVGKGHSNRAYKHFYEAFQISSAEECAKTTTAAKNSKSKIPISIVNNNGKKRRSAQKLPDQICPKTEKILRIWSRNKGPVSLHCFNGVTSDEAFTREALMIEALSLSNLTNKIFGQFRCNLKLNRRERSILGTYLLFKAFVFLILNGERQIRKGDNTRLHKNCDKMI